MTLLYENECGKEFAFDAKELSGEMIKASLLHEHFPFEAEVSLTIVDDEAIREINREYRQIDRSTDVLSFPMLSFEAPADFSAISDADKNPDTNEVMLGDIIISHDHVISQAGQYGHSTKREFAFLVVHIMLHLMGYDHMEDEERLLMEDHQRSILEKNNITRGDKSE